VSHLWIGRSSDRQLTDVIGTEDDTAYRVTGDKTTPSFGGPDNLNVSLRGTTPGVEALSPWAKLVCARTVHE
jgi:hypothetical protein